MQLTITERQLRALANVVDLEAGVGAVLAISKGEHLTESEMQDLRRRLRDVVDPLPVAEVQVSTDA